MNKTLFLNQETFSENGAAERRLELRLPVNHRGEIRVLDKSGHLLLEEATLEDWSESGCRIVAGIPLKAGDIVAIKPLELGEEASLDQQPQLFEIVWTNRRIAFWVAGAIKLQGEKLATLKFPPAKYASGQPSK